MWLFVAIGLLAAVFLLQANTPIRLDVDSVDYLTIAASIADGELVNPLGLPLGYPVFVAGLDRVGLARPFMFVLANCAWVAMGLVSLWYLFRDHRVERPWIVLFTMLSWPLIRHVAMPLPESMFFGISLASVALMEAAAGETSARSRIGFLATALTLAFVAMSVRLVGIALLPPFLLACYGGRRARKSIDKRKALIVAAAAAVILTASLLLMGSLFTKYLDETTHKLSLLGLSGTFADHAKRILLTLGEIVLNLPYAQFRSAAWIFLLAGIVFVVFVMINFNWWRVRTPATLYLACFVAVLIAWPYDAPRLWLPIIPLIIGYLSTAAPRFVIPRVGPKLQKLYAVLFAMGGLAAIGYSTRVALAGNNFSRVYGRASGVAPSERAATSRQSAYDAKRDKMNARYGN